MICSLGDSNVSGELAPSPTSASGIKPWKQRLKIPNKKWYPSTKPHGYISQMYLSTKLHSKKTTEVMYDNFHMYLEPWSPKISLPVSVQSSLRWSPCHPIWTKIKIEWHNFIKIHSSKSDLQTHVNWHSMTNNAHA
jgi:hypothetical protein